MSSIIELDQVSFAYRQSGAEEQTIIDRLSLTINKGEMVSIQGPSGSGKSTLLYLMAGLMEPQKGNINLCGKSLKTLSRLELAWLRNQNFGFIFQQFHLLPKANILNNILLPDFYPIEFNTSLPNRELALENIRELGLEKYLDQSPNQLSGGQQQRVAIGRALQRNPQIILADEPTGNLDSKSSQLIMSLLKNLHAKGISIVIITHDRKIAEQCSRQIYVEDGRVVKDTGPTTDHTQHEIKISSMPQQKKNWAKQLLQLIPLGFENLKRHRFRSFLTMFGIAVGIASVFSLVTLGNYTQKTILETYEALGVNRLVFRGYPNWDFSASDRVANVFRSFNIEKDMKPLLKIFPEIKMISPVGMIWSAKIHFGGRLSEDVNVLGVYPEYFEITNRQIFSGKFFTSFHLQNRSRVCMLGFEVAKKLFKNEDPLGKIINITAGDRKFTCMVYGVMKPQSSTTDWFKPDQEIIIPQTYSEVVADYWYSKIYTLVTQMKKSDDVEPFSIKIKAFFNLKYGKTGEFHVNSEDVILSQVKKFLAVFTILLGSIGGISLVVGGVGITNMMLVSVNERLREIGIRKAFGATNRSIRNQLLLESVMLCVLAGIFGILLGFVAYELIIWGATQFYPKMTFVWLFDATSAFVAFLCMIVVGVLSGLTPALQAAKKDVVSILRSE